VRAIFAATKILVSPDHVAQRLEGIANRDATIVVHVADRLGAFTVVENGAEDVQHVTDGRSLAVASRLAAVTDLGLSRCG
jgi:hypothetical protein